MLSKILIKITNNKYIDKKTKNQLIDECHNDEIISILKSKRITTDKKNQLIILLKNQINKILTTKYNENLFLIVPSEITLFISTFLNEKSLYNLYKSAKFDIFSENYNYHWKQLYINTFGNLRRVITPKYWSYFYVLSANNRCVDCHNTTQCNEPFYNITLCNKCKKLHKCLQLITYTTAKNEFKLLPNDFIKMEYIEVDNPHYKCSPNMKLYLKSDIYNYSLNKYNNEEGLQKEKEKSSNRKLKIKENKTIKINQREYELKFELSKFGLTIRPDSNLCFNYIHNKLDKSYTLEKVVNMIYETNWLYTKTNYKSELDKAIKEELEYLCIYNGGKHYKGIHHEAYENVKDDVIESIIEKYGDPPLLEPIGHSP